jgi:putative acetyltransferase
MTNSTVPHAGSPDPHVSMRATPDRIDPSSPHTYVRIETGSPHDPQVAALFALSDAYAASLYPAESNHMVDADSLVQPHVVFCVARRGEQILGCGASVLHPDYAEIKRMFVLEEARGLRLGECILEFLEEQTAARGVNTLRLETGIHSHPARRLYERCGYYLIGPFAGYWDDPLSVFYEKVL